MGIERINELPADREASIQAVLVAGGRPSGRLVAEKDALEAASLRAVWGPRFGFATRRSAQVS